MRYLERKRVPSHKLVLQYIVTIILFYYRLLLFSLTELNLSIKLYHRYRCMEKTHSVLATVSGIHLESQTIFSPSHGWGGGRATVFQSVNKMASFFLNVFLVGEFTSKCFSGSNLMLKVKIHIQLFSFKEIRVRLYIDFELVC